MRSVLRASWFPAFGPGVCSKSAVGFSVIAIAGQRGQALRALRATPIVSSERVKFSHCASRAGRSSSRA
jgi:hypothetical protein